MSFSVQECRCQKSKSKFWAFVTIFIPVPGTNCYHVTQ